MDESVPQHRSEEVQEQGTGRGLLVFHRGELDEGEGPSDRERDQRDRRCGSVSVQGEGSEDQKARCCKEKTEGIVMLLITVNEWFGYSRFCADRIKAEA